MKTKAEVSCPYCGCSVSIHLVAGKVSLQKRKKQDMENLIFPSRGWSASTRDFQIMLRALGYSPGEIDGVYGPQTEAAYQRYMAACGAE